MTTTLPAGLLLSLASPLAWACPACVPLVEAGIRGENFLLHLVLMALAVVLLLGIAVAVYHSDRFSRKGKGR